MVKGWVEKKLSDIGYFSKGKGISKSEVQNGNIPCIRYGEIYTSHNNYIKTFYSYISTDIAITSRRLKKGELLFSGSGETKEEIGKCVAFIDDCEAYAGGDIIILTPKIEVESKFLGYYLNSPKIAEQKASRGQGDAIVHISINALSEIDITLPPLPEQRRLAAVLSDTDEFIASLEKLIAKKRAVKHGAMQELLTGKRRLPGFSGEWVERSIDYYGDFTSGNCFPLIYQGEKSGKYPFYKVSDFSNAGNKYMFCFANNYISHTIATELNCNIIPKGSIIFAKIGAAIFLERKRKNAQDCCIDNNMMAFTVNNEGDSQYIMYLLQMEKFESIITATALPSLSSKQVGAITKIFPPTKKEQTAIAAILSDMDAEIDSLTAKLNKLKSIKQGMMSELLTGRIRLQKKAEVTVPTVKIMQFPKQQEAKRKHNQAIEDAVILGVITNLYANEQYPLAPFYAQKLPYLLHRHIEGAAKGYYKLPAGPYNPSYRYKTALPIALKNRYVDGHKANFEGHEYINLTTGVKFKEAKNYFIQWHGVEPLDWLKQFKYIKNRRNELELLTTVDMAMVELRYNNMPVTISAVKDIIKKSEMWKDKLKRSIFSDENISRAIAWSNELFMQKENIHDEN